MKHKIVAGNLKLVAGSGVNLDRFSLMNYPKDDEIHFLYIGRVMKEKGIDQYLATAKYIRNKYPNTVFHVLGFCEEDYGEKLKDMQEKGYIQYHGMQNDIRKFQKISHCTIHATYYPEGMSNVLLESSACGRAIITTNRSGCREIVDDELNGYIVEQQNTKDLISKVEKFLSLTNDEKKSMGLAGRRKVERQFDRKKVINAYMEEIYKLGNEEYIQDFSNVECKSM